MTSTPSAGDAIATGSHVIEVRVAELRQLFMQSEVRLLDRLIGMRVRIEYHADDGGDGWRSDWPAAPSSRLTATPARAHMDTGGRGRSMQSRNDGHEHSPDEEHQHTPEEERRIREAALDRTIEASFPASDPPSSAPNPYDPAALERQHDRPARR